MMFRTRLLLGRMGMYDQYQDWRLDVDNMNYEVPPSAPHPSATDFSLHLTVFFIKALTLSFNRIIRQELLALEDRIGYVSTGLREDEITRGLKVGKHLAFDHRKHFSAETERSC